MRNRALANIFPRKMSDDGLYYIQNLIKFDQILMKMKNSILNTQDRTKKKHMWISKISITKQRVWIGLIYVDSIIAHKQDNPSQAIKEFLAVVDAEEEMGEWWDWLKSNIEKLGDLNLLSNALKCLSS